MKYSKYFSDETDPKILDGQKCNETVECASLQVVLKELDKAREYIGKPFTITSGLRLANKNAAVGGVSNSAHLKGEAVDFVVKNVNLFSVYQYIVEKLNFDKVIFENKNGVSWIHFSNKIKGNRKIALIAVYNNGKMEYQEYKGGK